MSFNPSQPYNDLPLLPPQVDLETKAVLKRCVAANKTLVVATAARSASAAPVHAPAHRPARAAAHVPAADNVAVAAAVTLTIC